MKDLKHLNYFEDLLQDSGNELADKARAAGSICIGTTCYQIPEVLLNLPGCFAARMRAPRTGSMEMGTYYMTSLNCEFARALLERCLEGSYGFLDCIIEPFACSQMTSTMLRYQPAALSREFLFYLVIKLYIWTYSGAFIAFSSRL